MASAALAASALGVLAGCRPAPQAPAAPRRLRVELPADELPTVASLLEATVRDHARRLGYEVELTRGAPEGVAARYPPGRGDLPDVVVVDTAGPARLYWDVSLLDVTAAAEREARRNGELPPTLRRALTHDEKLWAVPLYGRAWAWLLRQDLLDARGLPVPSTFADALGAAMQLADPSRGLAGWAVPLLATPEGEAFVHRVILDYGGSLADASGRRVVIASPATVEAFGFLAGLVRGASRVALPSDREAWAAPGREALFKAGKLALAPVSTALYAEMVADGAIPRKALRATTPLAGPKRRTTSAAGRHCVVAASTRHPELCLDLISELASPARLRELMVAAEGAVVPAYANLTADPFWDADPTRQAFAVSVRGDASRQLDLVEYGDPGPVTPGAAEVAAQLVLSTAATRCADGLITPDAAAQECQTRAEAIYDRVARSMSAIRRERR